MRPVPQQPLGLPTLWGLELVASSTRSACLSDLNAFGVSIRGGASSAAQGAPPNPNLQGVLPLLSLPPSGILDAISMPSGVFISSSGSNYLLSPASASTGYCARQYPAQAAAAPSQNKMPPAPLYQQDSTFQVSGVEITWYNDVAQIRRGTLEVGANGVIDRINWVGPPATWQRQNPSGTLGGQPPPTSCQSSQRQSTTSRT